MDIPLSHILDVADIRDIRWYHFFDPLGAGSLCNVVYLYETRMLKNLVAPYHKFPIVLKFCKITERLGKFKQKRILETKI